MKLPHGAPDGTCDINMLRKGGGGFKGALVLKHKPYASFINTRPSCNLFEWPQYVTYEICDNIWSIWNFKEWPDNLQGMHLEVSLGLQGVRDVSEMWQEECMYSNRSTSPGINNICKVYILDQRLMRTMAVKQHDFFSLLCQLDNHPVATGYVLVFSYQLRWTYSR